MFYEILLTQACTFYQSSLAGIAVHTMHGCKMIGMPECDVLLAQCTTYLARAPKSRLMEDALRAAQRVVAEHKGPQPGVPLHLRNAPTRLMRDLGKYLIVIITKYVRLMREVTVLLIEDYYFRI